MAPAPVLLAFLALMSGLMMVPMCAKKKGKCCVKKRPRRSKKNMTLDKKTQADLEKFKVFMEQDAKDKADQILQQAEEEAAIEKQRIVKAEVDKQEAHFEKEKKKMELDYKRRENAAAQEANLDLQRYRYELLQKAYTEVRDAVIDQLKDRDQYRGFMLGSLQEAVYRLHGQKKIHVRCRKKDLPILKELPKEIDDTQIILEEMQPLARDSLGGLVASSECGKVWVDCTVQKRIKEVLKQMEPWTRNRLFEPEKSVEPSMIEVEHLSLEEHDGHSSNTQSARSFIRGNTAKTVQMSSSDRTADPNDSDKFEAIKSMELFPLVPATKVPSSSVTLGR